MARKLFQELPARPSTNSYCGRKTLGDGMRKLCSSCIAATFTALFVLLGPSLQAAEDELFPRPDSLQPAIAFWTRVYSEVDSQAGFIHDSRQLNRVYQTLRFKRYHSPSQQDQIIEKMLRRYQTALLALSKGKREELDDVEQKLLTLWGDDATPAMLKEAAANVRFQRGQSDRLRNGIISSGAWENHIDQTLREYGLPTELLALPHVESSYNPLVRSSAGAAGIWQFTRFTGKHYLRVDHVVDERFDPHKSTQAAARFLHRYHTVLNSWPLAITAYNHGLSGVRRAVRETGSDDIGEIIQHYRGSRFGFASRNFYAAFLAVVDITGDSESHFGILQRDHPDSFWIVKLPVYLPLSAVTEQLDLDTGVLRALNPALQRSVWKGKKYVPKDYHLRLPQSVDNKGVTTVIKQIAMADGRTDQIPDIIYKVQRGDTLSEIAQRFKTNVRELMALNNLQSKNHIRSGQSLRLLNESAAKAVEFASVHLVAIDD
jgi:membrane-bound lytic murein transglycosylase D